MAGRDQTARHAVTAADSMAEARMAWLRFASIIGTPEFVRVANVHVVR